MYGCCFLHCDVTDLVPISTVRDRETIRLYSSALQTGPHKLCHQTSLGHFGWASLVWVMASFQGRYWTAGS